MGSESDKQHEFLAHPRGRFPRPEDAIGGKCWRAVSGLHYCGQPQDAEVHTVPPALQDESESATMSEACRDGEHQQCVGRVQVPAGVATSIPWQSCKCKCHTVAPDEPAHVDFVFDNLPCCKVCGLVKPHDGWKKPCKGPTRLSLRAPDERVEGDQELVNRGQEPNTANNMWHRDSQSLACPDCGMLRPVTPTEQPTDAGKGSSANAEIIEVLRGLLSKLDSDINCAYVAREYCQQDNAAHCAYHKGANLIIRLSAYNPARDAERDDYSPCPDPRCNDHLGAMPIPQCVTAVAWAEKVTELEVIAEAARDFIWEPENWEAYMDSKGSDSVAWPPEFLLMAQAVGKKYGPMPIDDAAYNSVETTETKK